MELQEQFEAIGALLAEALTSNSQIAPLGIASARPLYIAPDDHVELGKLCIVALCNAGYRITTPNGDHIQKK